MTHRYDPAEYWSSRLSGRFDLVGSGYAALGDRFNRRLYEARVRALENALKSLNREFAGARVLEIGCGTGFYTEYCSRVGVRDYVGLDLTEVSVSRLRERYPGYRFLQADVGLPIRVIDEDFDVVLAADVLFHIIDGRAFTTAIDNAGRWLRPKGLFIVSDVFPEEDARTAPHCLVRGKGTYQTELERNSLRTLRIEPIFVVLQPPLSLPSTGWAWRLYSQSWRIGIPLSRIGVVDMLFPPLLGFLDRWFFLPLFGGSAPNNKWLLAMKEDVA